MSNLKLILEVNQDGKLILPFSRRVLNLPRIENCSQFRNLVTQQGNNFVWLYTGNYDKIRFKTTERELHEVFDRYAIKKCKQSKKCEDVILLDGVHNTTDNEEDDNDGIQWIKD
ncbi:unnamed protein product [Rotaria sordida]|uniref:Uncharacterized protein n=1 Tax=Rotaria sordida TaxID=392033 RepID=A0A820EPL9_9BILA|nr:unnamed protein product [Rotaria sordida]